MTNNIVPGNIYAVTRGTYYGSNYVVIELSNNHVDCLNLPTMENISIPIDDIHQGIDMSIIELIEVLPDDIMEICTKQYEKNINNR